MELTINAATTALKPIEGSRVENSRASDLLEARVKSHSEPKPKPKPKPKPEPDVRSLERAADRLNQALQAFDRDLAISIHDDGKVVVKVTDPSTGEVVRQIPPERVLEVEEHLDSIVGLFVNDEA